MGRAGGGPWGAGLPPLKGALSRSAYPRALAAASAARARPEPGGSPEAAPVPSPLPGGQVCRGRSPLPFLPGPAAAVVRAAGQ